MEFSFLWSVLFDRPSDMKRRAIASAAIGLAVCSLCSGCASVISGRHADVAIDSYPSNAHVVVHDNDGRAVASFETPGVVSLKRNRRYFLPARYTATIEAPGYQPAQVPIRSTVNPWVLGNVIIGGVPGLIVDNATGAVWRPRQCEIHRQLTPLRGSDQNSMYSANEPAAPADSKDRHRVADRAEQTSFNSTGRLQ
jgi:hypothetical protein